MVKDLLNENGKNVYKHCWHNIETVLKLPNLNIIWIVHIYISANKISIDFFPRNSDNHVWTALKCFKKIPKKNIEIPHDKNRC